MYKIKERDDTTWRVQFYTTPTRKRCVLIKTFYKKNLHSFHAHTNEVVLITEGRVASSIHLVVNATGYKFVVGINGDLYHINVTGGGSNYSYTSSYLTRVVNYPISRLIKGKTDAEGRLWYSK